MKFFFTILFMFALFQSHGQATYTDFVPNYVVAYDYYIIDKIAYYPDEIVLSFRFVCDNSEYTGATFFTEGGRHPWFLKPHGDYERIPLKSIQHVYRDNELITKKIDRPNYSIPALSKTGHTVYTCEIHFARPPEGVQKVDLIEGEGMEDSRNFNCFSIELRQEDEDLGSDKDRQKKIYAFEQKFGIERNKPEPTEEKESPKPEETPQSRPKNALESAQDIRCNELLLLSNVHFHDNSTHFKGMVAAKYTLTVIRDYMYENPETTITLYGHTDIFGDPDENKELSKSRVLKIQRWLSMNGVKPHRIESEWYGSERPLVESGDPKNRRVEVKLHCP